MGLDGETCVGLNVEEGDVLLPNWVNPLNSLMEARVRVQEVRSGHDHRHSLASLEVQESVSAGHVVTQGLVPAVRNVPLVFPFYLLGAFFHLAQNGIIPCYLVITCGQ